MSPAKSRNANPYLPPARVVTMIVMLAIMVIAIFTLMSGSWIVGGVLGLGFAAAFYFVVIVNARRATSKKRRSR
jgi:uncharacterized membrane protein